ncbi:uncharacterized protein A1O9_00436 [Exophiala aquamarina CBS 119918]|uniref:C2H2-type domain-containing protein n=1 Tax=Exophiala aquamarina CBS 119918 TaxID=1182545 RepID=A0A072PQS7_9EURO|nr:uncharacterized protein A1O9_00436 [Exophiala aquamarina CBS 119918]KEF62464.1 hypothetical protein A1O9_00436 [Exophiala aquamarina CBS 119918]
MSEPKRPRIDDSLSATATDTQVDSHPNSISDAKQRSSKNETRRRFECTYAGCGRHYSRAEHLYRHQLNHNPKEIFKCDYPGCSRTFVRQDLCIRHRERHENRGKIPSGQHATSREPLSPRSSMSDGNANSPGSPVSNIFATPKQLSEGLQSSVLHRSSFSESNFKPTNLQALIQQPAQEGNVSNSGPPQTLPAMRRPSYVNPEPRISRQPSNFGFADMPAESTLSLQRSHSLTETAFDTSDHTILSNGVGILGDARNKSAQDKAVPTFPVPTLSDQAFNDSPASVRDEFTAWLFEDAGGLQTAAFSMGVPGGLGFPSAGDAFNSGIYPNYFTDPALDQSYPDIAQVRPQETISKALEISSDSDLLSYAKRKSLLNLMELTFNDGDNRFVGKLREEIFRGNLDAEDHVLSLRSMQHYIGSYWYHFHAQMPILHQPTFSAENTHDYLLLAVMAIGAAYLNKAHGRQVTDAAARLATFIAWHLRWQVFMHNDFHPPSKLWVFQTLLLLEIYEKMNSTRMLHERSHIHYATTINLMRRGTALIETGNQDAWRTPTTPEEWWSRWITAEATRRAAYAAFYLDAVHATMFGHAAMMVVHEIRLPLPCDDALWSATSAAEVGRVEASLHANGIKPTTFLDGLKKTLTGRRVRTNNFGRMILMAGLLSVSWHMHQRDLQVSSLGVSQSMGAPDGWRTPLTKAFEFWKKDFDENLEHMRKASLPWQKHDVGSGEEDMAKAAYVLHHLSHMSMHVDIMDCQIFAGSKRLFGRTVSNADYERVKCKIFDWAKGQSASVGVFHALQLLRSVIPPTKDGSKKLYNARDDHLVIRPWASYFAALVVWSYGFAMDGVLRPFPSLIQATPELQLDAVVKDAHVFLSTVGAVKTPQGLDAIKDGRNNVVGVLAILETAFRDSRWELLHEAADLLRNAIMLLRGASRG